MENSICQLFKLICVFKTRKTEVFLILHHCAIDSLPVTRSHTTLSREVMIAWRCKAFTALYSGKPAKKLDPSVLQRWRLFLFRVSWFFTRFHSRFLLIIAVISTKRSTNEGVWEEDLNLFFRDTGKIKSCFYTLFLEKNLLWLSI